MVLPTAIPMDRPYVDRFLINLMLPMGTAFIVWLYLAARADWDTGYLKVGLTRISNETGLTKKTILKHVNTLEEKGYLKITRQHRHVTVYQIPKKLMLEPEHWLMVTKEMRPNHVPPASVDELVDELE